MYENLNIAEFEEAGASIVLTEDRKLFSPFYETVEKYCAEHKLILCGQVSRELLIGEKFGINSYPWEVLCEKGAFVHSKQLADELYNTKSPHIPTKTVMLQTNLKHRELTIYIYGRIFLKIYLFGEYRGVPLSNVWQPVLRKSHFLGIDVLCLNPKMHLMEIYRHLYTPIKNALWVSLLEQEKKIVAQIDFSSEAVDVRKHDTIKRIEEIVKEHFLKSSDNVVIGDHALCQLLQVECGRLQFISNDDMGDVIEILKSLISRKLNKNVKLYHVKFHTNILSDFQLEKYTIYMEEDAERGGQINLMDIYNSSSYELIPYRLIDDFKIANNWVVLRFYLIDLWIISVAVNVAKNKSAAFQARIDLIYHNIRLLHDSFIDRIDLNPLAYFQKDSYVGVYIEESIAKKKLIAKEERSANYYPYLV